MIAVVAEDPAARRSLQMLLVAQGHKVRAYASARALLADGATDRTTCLIMGDAPDPASGAQMLSRLREAGLSCPAILIAAALSPACADQGDAAGYAAVFETPLRRHALIDAVARLAAGEGLA